MVGVDDPFEGLTLELRPRRRGNQDSSSSFVSTSGILTPDEYPQFLSWPSTRWDKPGGPFAPHTGDQYVYSQIADVSYKRLSREVEVPGGRRQPDVLDVVRHRAGLGLRDRRGSRRGQRRLDDAAGRERHIRRTDTGDQLRGRLVGELHPCSALPDVRPAGAAVVHADRDDR